MSYEEALALAYTQLPVFHRDGRSAIKPGLAHIIQFCEYLGNPQDKLKCIHIAGTNGKGSTSHMLAAILQCAGYKVGLYTSPHLKNFTERIRINGVEMDRQRVAEFIEQHREVFLNLDLSFFELTVAMAFDEFARQQVDVAVIETGLGGLLDSTNIIQPVLSVITNVSYDHIDVLGKTLPEIAAQKAGIIKPRTPVVLSHVDETLISVFREAANRVEASLFVANLFFQVEAYEMRGGRLMLTVNVGSSQQETYSLELIGLYQRFNVPGVLQSIEVLNKLGFIISKMHTATGLHMTIRLTGLKGRWQRIGEYPLTFCDTGHNEAGFSAILECIYSIPHGQLYIVLGCVRDKDVMKILKQLPNDAKYLFCEAASPRALPCNELQILANTLGIFGTIIPNVNEALAYARIQAEVNDLIVVCGSTYLVAELQEL